MYIKYKNVVKNPPTFSTKPLRECNLNEFVQFANDKTPSKGVSEREVMELVGWKVAGLVVNKNAPDGKVGVLRLASTSNGFDTYYEFPGDEQVFPLKCHNDHEVEFSVELIADPVSA